MLSTPWSRGFGLRVPIVNAPMGGWPAVDWPPRSPLPAVWA
ncbi:hypothetical protein I547_5199 [Mycobacterium kansasii 824]|nr:hypothetical protein I547_5199 [Mycobacterium kansasii 824]